MIERRALMDAILLTNVGSHRDTLGSRSLHSGVTTVKNTVARTRHRVERVRVGNRLPADVQAARLVSVGVNGDPTRDITTTERISTS